MSETEVLQETDSVAEDVRGFLEERIPLARDVRRLDDDASLLEAGIIDSMGVLELVDFIDERFGLAVREEDMVPENFDSIAGIVAFVRRSQAAL